MKKNLIKLLILFLIVFLNVNAFSQTITVTDANFTATGWEKSQTTTEPTPGSKEVANSMTRFVSIVCGTNNPKAPFLARGCAYLTLPVSIDRKLTRVRLRNSNHEALLKDITELKYSTYTPGDASVTPVHPAVAPLLILQIDMDGDGANINNITFEPGKQQHILKTNGGIIPRQEVELNHWQEWDALNGWWRLGKLDAKHPMPPLFTITDFLKEYEKAKIINTRSDDPASPNGGPGIRFTVGVGPASSDFIDFKGYIDAFKITTNGTLPVVYDFKSTQRCNPDISRLRPKIIYIIISSFVILGCFIGFRYYSRNRRRKNSK